MNRPLLAVDRTLDALTTWLRLDVRYYVKSSVHLALGQAVVLLVGLATSMLFVRLVSQETYGQFNYVVSVLGLLSVFSLPGLSTAIARGVARGHEKVFVQGVKVRLKWSLLGSLATAGVGLYYLLVKSSEAVGASFLLSSVVFPLFATAQAYNAVLHGRRQFGRLALYQSVSSVVSGVALIVALYLFASNLVLVFATWLVSFSAMHVLWLVLTLRGPLAGDTEQGALAFGKHMTVQGTIETVVQYYDKVIIGLFLGFSDLALYSIALTVMLLERVAYLPLGPAFPRLAQLEEGAAYREVRRHLPIGILGFGLVCGAAAVGVYYLIPVVYTAAYSGAVPYAQLLVLSILMAGPGEVLTQLFKSQQKVAALYKLSIASGIMQIVLTTALALPFGIAGVVVARVLVQSGRTLVAWLLFVRSRSRASTSF